MAAFPFRELALSGNLQALAESSCVDRHLKRDGHTRDGTAHRLPDAAIQSAVRLIQRLDVPKAEIRY